MMIMQLWLSGKLFSSVHTDILLAVISDNTKTSSNSSYKSTQQMSKIIFKVLFTLAFMATLIYSVGIKMKSESNVGITTKCWHKIEKQKCGFVI